MHVTKNTVVEIVIDRPMHFASEGYNNFNMQFNSGEVMLTMKFETDEVRDNFFNMILMVINERTKSPTGTVYTYSTDIPSESDRLAAMRAVGAGTVQVQQD